VSENRSRCGSPAINQTKEHIMPGAIIYRGPSELDGQPIVVIAVWSSKNRKTGAMLQTYLLRSDIDPREANKYGEDESICGDCQHRGTPTFDPTKVLAEERTCYVVMGQGPLIVFNTFKAGKYPDHSTPAQRRALGRKRKVRIGTYGDGAAAPSYVWDELLSEADGHTAYSHNGGDPVRYMISADSLQEAQQAWASEYRTFRIIHDVSEIDSKHETLCPASKEAGYRTTCESCLLCGGTSVKAKSIAIPVHGSGAVHFK
jgi:hypothetical protein